MKKIDKALKKKRLLFPKRLDGIDPYMNKAIGLRSELKYAPNLAFNLAMQEQNQFLSQRPSNLIRPADYNAEVVEFMRQANAIQEAFNKLDKEEYANKAQDQASLMQVYNDLLKQSDVMKEKAKVADMTVPQLKQEIESYGLQPASKLKANLIDQLVSVESNQMTPVKSEVKMEEGLFTKETPEQRRLSSLFVQGESSTPTEGLMDRY